MVIKEVNIISNTETYELIASIIRHAPYGMLVVNEQGEIIMCNQQLLKHLALDEASQSLLGKPLQELFNHLPELETVFRRYVQNEEKEGFNISGLPYHNGHLDIKGRKIHQGVLLTTMDVSRAKRLEQESIHAIVEGQEGERRRLAKEIHDGIGPLMSTIKLNLDAVKMELADASPRLLGKINTMEDLLQMVASDIRSISHALMPGAIVDFGLVSAVENLCAKANESGRVQINFYHTGMDERVDPNIELGLYRIAQELLNNAVKYARARTINLQLIRHARSIVLMVEDDGAGFDPKQVRKGGIGLQNIKTRTKSLRGAFTLETQPGQGVLATVEIPCS